MLSNVQKFLNNGLLQVDSINANVKRFIQETHEDFYEWVSDEDNIYFNAKCYNNEKLREFTTEFKGWEKTMTSKKFMKFISEYANYKGCNLIKKRDQKGRYFIIESNNTTIKHNDDNSIFDGSEVETPF